jgi:hypothetical protein
MGEDRAKILNMLKEGKISVEEAGELLDALGKKCDTGERSQSDSEPKKNYKYLCIHVVGGDNKKEKVNVKIPLGLIRAGVKMNSLIPNQAWNKLNLKFNEKGIKFDLGELNPENIEELIQALGELSVDVEDGEDKVRVFCE